MINIKRMKTDMLMLKALGKGYGTLSGTGSIFISNKHWFLYNILNLFKNNVKLNVEITNQEIKKVEDRYKKTIKFLLLNKIEGKTLTEKEINMYKKMTAK
jgi:hypothetical protein